MVFYQIISKILAFIFFVIASLLSLLLVITLIFFVFNLSDRNTLQNLLIILGSTTFTWGLSFLSIILGSKKNKQEKKQEFFNLVRKLPMLLVSVIINTFYMLIWMFFVWFISISDYEKGGWGATLSPSFEWYMLILMTLILFGIMMYKIFRTDRKDMSLLLYNQFLTLKWASLITLPFGLWSVYYFYHKAGFLAWLVMIIWGVILLGFFKFFNGLAEKVLNSITDTNLNRILHEKKKKMLKKNLTDTKKEKSTYSDNKLADEILKLHNLVEKGIITQDDFITQKNKLLNK